MDNEVFEIHDLVEVPKWTRPFGKNWTIVGFSSDGAEACLRRCTDNDVQTFILLSEVTHQKEMVKDNPLVEHNSTCAIHNDPPAGFASSVSDCDCGAEMLDEDPAPTYGQQIVTEKVRLAREEALTWVLERLTEGLALASFDDNVGCITRLIDDVRKKLGLPPVGCTRDGYRDICKQCPAKQRDICKSEDVSSSRLS